MIRVVHLNFSEMSGGAARAAHRLHTGMIEHAAADLESRMLVLRKTTTDPTVIPIRLNRLERSLRRRTLRRLERPAPHQYPGYDGSPWTNARASTPVRRMLRQIKPAVLNLHWIGDGLLSVADLARLPGPLVWTLHDLWALTGGCHYSGDCDRFTGQCGACPLLGSAREHDLSWVNWQRKQRGWHNLNLTLVAPSHWMADQVRRSALFGDFRVVVIPNGIDTARYHPLTPPERLAARATFGLPTDRKLVLFGAYQADDRRKGGTYLHQALRHLAQQPADGVDLVVFGSGTVAADGGYTVHQVGQLDDETRLAQLYAACDIFVAPSIQDNLPNTIMEALACGTPSVGFGIGGIPDMIAHQQNGYLAAPLSAADLAHGIQWVLAAGDEVRRAARETVIQHFSLEMAVERYHNLYADRLAASNQTLMELQRQQTGQPGYDG